MKTLFTFYIENSAGEIITLAKVADTGTAVQLLGWYKSVYSTSQEWRCYIKERYKKAALVDYVTL